MKKNVTYVTATEMGVLVAVKTKLSKQQMTKIKDNKELLENLCKDLGVEVIFLGDEEYDKDFNFCIGAYEADTLTPQEVVAKASHVMASMDNIKDWLEKLDENDDQENTEEIPDQCEIDFIKEIKKEGPFMIKGMAMDEEGFFPISISSGCFTRMLDTYLEKYGS